MSELISQLSNLKITLVQDSNPIFFRANFQLLYLFLLAFPLSNLTHLRIILFMYIGTQFHTLQRAYHWAVIYENFHIQCVTSYFTAIKCNNNAVNKSDLPFVMNVSLHSRMYLN